MSFWVSWGCWVHRGFTIVLTEKLPGKFGELPGKSGDFPEARGSLTPYQRLAKFVSNLSVLYLRVCSSTVLEENIESPQREREEKLRQIPAPSSGILYPVFASTSLINSKL